MAETPSGAVSAETTGGVTAPASGAESTGQGDGGKTAADEIRALRKRAQEAEARAETLAKAEAKRLEAEALARGEHESVINRLREENEQLAAKAAQFEAAQTARREALLTGLTDDDRALAEGLPLDKLESLVARLGKTVAAPAPVVPVVAGPAGGAGTSGNLTPEEIKAGVRKGGLAWFRENSGRM